MLLSSILIALFRRNFTYILPAVVFQPQHLDLVIDVFVQTTQYTHVLGVHKCQLATEQLIIAFFSKNYKLGIIYYRMKG
jgi:hypothetical protein